MSTLYSSPLDIGNHTVSRYPNILDRHLKIREFNIIEWSKDHDTRILEMLSHACRYSGIAVQEECLYGHTEHISLNEGELAEIDREKSIRVARIRERGTQESIKEADEWDNQFKRDFEFRDNLSNTIEGVNNFTKNLTHANQLSRETVSEHNEWHNSTSADASFVGVTNRLKDLSQADSEVISQFPQIKPIIGQLHKGHKMHTQLSAWNSNIKAVSSMGAGMTNKLPEGWNKRLDTNPWDTFVNFSLFGILG